MKIRLLLFLGFHVLSHTIVAQSLDSIQQLQGIEITAPRLSVFSAGIRIEKADSATLQPRQNTNLAALIAESGMANIRSYGPGGIATLSIRGTSATQSGVFWNGINLSQPNMGMTDLSRIPVFLFNSVALQSGGAGALLGSGIFGGSLQLSNEHVYPQPLEATVLISGASAHRLAEGVRIKAAGKRISISSSTFADNNLNDFRYTALDGSRKRLDHSRSKSLATLNQVNFKLSEKQQLSVGAWYETADRLIPPTMVMARSDQRQQDRSLRASLQWMYFTDNQNITIRTAAINEKEHFESESSSIDAIYNLSTYMIAADYKRYVSHRFTAGTSIEASLLSADVPYYNSKEQQAELAFLGSLAYRSENAKLRGAFNIRQDLVSGYKIPFCPALSADYQLNNKFSFRTTFSRNFRIPTMNDRFWVPGGNSELECENSWNQEAGFVFSQEFSSNSKLKIDLNLYNILIQDLIQWVPADAGIWIPQNVQKVWSRGLDVKFDARKKYNKIYVQLLAFYHYNPSTYIDNNSKTDEQNGKQLIYIPVNKAGLAAKLNAKGYFANLEAAFNDKQYYISDNSQYLKEYFIVNLDAGKQFRFNQNQIKLFLQLENIFNVSYQNVLYYPEKGRSLSVSIQITQKH